MSEREHVAFVFSTLSEWNFSNKHTQERLCLIHGVQGLVLPDFIIQPYIAVLNYEFRALQKSYRMEKAEENGEITCIKAHNGSADMMNIQCPLLDQVIIARCHRATRNFFQLVSVALRANCLHTVGVGENRTLRFAFFLNLVEQTWLLGRNRSHLMIIIRDTVDLSMTSTFDLPKKLIFPGPGLGTISTKFD